MITLFIVSRIKVSDPDVIPALYWYAAAVEALIEAFIVSALMGILPV